MALLGYLFAGSPWKTKMALAQAHRALKFANELKF